LASGKKKGLLHFIDTARAKWGTQVKKEIFKQPCLLHREPISERFLSNSIPKNQILICVQPSPLNVTQSASMHFQRIGSQSVTDEKREKKLK